MISVQSFYFIDFYHSNVNTDHTGGHRRRFFRQNRYHGSRPGGIHADGSLGSCFGSYLFQNAFAGLAMGILVSMLVSFLFGIFTINFRVNQVICGIGFNMFASGFTAAMTQMVWGTRANSAEVAVLPKISIPVLGTCQS